MGEKEQQVAAVPVVHTAGEGKERMSEVLFWLAVFFGLLHFASIAGQVGMMFLHTTLQNDVTFPIRSSMVLGHIYIGFLVAYVGREAPVGRHQQGPAVRGGLNLLLIGYPRPISAPQKARIYCGI